MGKKERKSRYGNPANRRPVQDPMLQDAGFRTVGDLYRARQPTGVSDPRTLGGSMVDVADDPNASGTVVLDTTDAVLLGNVEVCAVDSFAGGRSVGVQVFMILNGRVNRTPRMVQAGYLMDADGAAAIIANLMALMVRGGVPWMKELATALIDLDQAGHGSVDMMMAVFEAVSRTRADDDTIHGDHV